MVKKYLSDLVGVEILNVIKDLKIVADEIVDKLKNKSPEEENPGGSGEDDEQDPLTYSSVTLKSGTIYYLGSDNKYYTSNNGTHIFVGVGEYELSDGKILTIKSDGTGTITTPTIPSQPEEEKKITTWVEDFEAIDTTSIYNDSNSWYELDIVGGRLRAILREPDTTANFATFFINIPKPLDLSDGAYFSIDINSINTEPGTPVGTASWNNGNCFNARFVDTSGGVSSWIPICANGIGHSGGIMPAGVSIVKENIGSYAGSIDYTNICKLEISLIGWLTYETVSYKNRNKGVYIDNIRLSNSATDSTTDTETGGELTGWSENFETYDASSVINTVNSWYTPSVTSGELRIAMIEPASDTSVGWFFIPVTNNEPVNISNNPVFSISLRGNGDPVFSLKLKDADGNYSRPIDIGRSGVITSSGDSITSSTVIEDFDISSYLTGIDATRVIGVECNMISWSFSTPSFKSRSKTIWIDSISLGNQSSSSSSASYSRVASTYSTLTTSDFNAAEDVYKSIKTGDRVIFIVRHSERGSQSGRDAGITENGLAMLSTAAAKLTGAPFSDTTNDAYYSTYVKRTVETAYFVGRARNPQKFTRSTLFDTDWENETLVIHSESTSGPNRYFKDGPENSSSSWPFAQTYYKEHKTDCITYCETAINWIVQQSEGHPFTFLCSHDLVMVPFVCWAADNGDFFSTWNNDYDSNPSGWINYLSGISVIVHSNGTWEVYPVKMLDNGKFD